MMQCKQIMRMLHCLNVSTTPITAMGCRQCLPLSVVQLKGKHCRKPHCRNEVVNMFGNSYFYDITTCPSGFLDLPMALYQASEWQINQQRPLNMFSNRFASLCWATFGKWSHYITTYNVATFKWQQKISVHTIHSFNLELNLIIDL